MRCSRAWQLQLHDSTPIEQPLYHFRRVETRRVVLRGCDSGSPSKMVSHRTGRLVPGSDRFWWERILSLRSTFCGVQNTLFTIPFVSNVS